MNNDIIIERGAIWWVELDPTQGGEINKTRPCLIISNNVLNRLRKTVVAIPLSTSAKANPPITISVSSLKDSVAIMDQIRAVSRHRLKSKIGKIKDLEMQIINRALIPILELS
jgi:mRNA interferase MazF